MTRRLKWSWVENVTLLTVSSVQSTRWRLCVRTATVVSSATASKRMDKSSVVSIARARPAQRS